MIKTNWQEMILLMGGESNGHTGSLDSDGCEEHDGGEGAHADSHGVQLC